MKLLVTLMLVFAMVFAVAGCGNIPALAKTVVQKAYTLTVKVEKTVDSFNVVSLNQNANTLKKYLTTTDTALTFVLNYVKNEKIKENLVKAKTILANVITVLDTTVTEQNIGQVKDQLTATTQTVKDTLKSIGISLGLKEEDFTSIQVAGVDSDTLELVVEDIDKMTDDLLKDIKTMEKK